jgi:hypothetical protein
LVSSWWSSHQLNIHHVSDEITPTKLDILRHLPPPSIRVIYSHPDSHMPRLLRPRRLRTDPISSAAALPLLSLIPTKAAKPRPAPAQPEPPRPHLVGRGLEPFTRWEPRRHAGVSTKGSRQDHMIPICASAGMTLLQPRM